MAGSKLPLSVAEKHRILYIHPAPPAELVQLGRRHKEAGFLHDALEFFQRAGAAEELRAMVPLAADTADLVLLLNAYKALESEPEAQVLHTLHERAREMGKESVARRAALLIASIR